MSKQEVDEKRGEMTFLEHLEELRWHLIRSILAIVVLGILAFIFHKFIFDVILLAPKTQDFITNKAFHKFGMLMFNSNKLDINNIPFEIINIKMAGQFSTHIMVSLIAGLILAFPYIFWEFWRFVEPALYEHEKKNARGAVFFTSLLFMLGVLFGYYVIVPLSVHFLGSYNISEQVSNKIGLDSYISTVTSVVLASGVIFELPILIYFLSKAGIVTPEFLKRYRRHAVILILTVAAIITPPDVFSQILVSLPLFVLYEVGIAISKRIVKDEERKLARIT